VPLICPTRQISGPAADCGGPARRHRPEGGVAFQAVARIVGFGLERLKILDLSMEID
jgi:hypothetical protein